MKLYQKMHFLVFSKKFRKPWMKLKICFANFQILGSLGCQGWVVIPQNVKKKSKIPAPYYIWHGNDVFEWILFCKRKFLLVLSSIVCENNFFRMLSPRIQKDSLLWLKGTGAWYGFLIIQIHPWYITKISFIWIGLNEQNIHLTLLSI